MGTAPSGELSRLLRRAARSPLTVLGAALVTAMALLAVFAPLIATHDPVKLDILARFSPPSAAHLFGTDEVGRDIFSRVVIGARTSMLTAILVVACASVAGALIGCLSGLIGGAVDTVVMRLTDIVMSIPGLVLAIALSAALGPSLANMMIALGFMALPPYIRLARAQALSLRHRGYVEAAQAFGASIPQQLRWHILPNALSPIVVRATLDTGMVILAAAALGFLGLGAQPPEPEWGGLIATGRSYVANAWWYPTFPGLAILVTAMGFNLLGDGIRDLIDPRRQQR